MKDILLEIGVEEIPARFVSDALENLRKIAEARFMNAGIFFNGAATVGTPRRLALLMKDVSEKGEERVRENLGPGAAQAKDKDGNWTPAAQGFARANGTTPEKLEIRETERGPRLCAVIKEGGLSTEKALPEILPEIIGKIPFPKTMKWNDTGFAFARPIRWIVALYGTKTVKFSLAGVKSGKSTFGLRVQGLKPLTVPSPEKYVSLLRNKCVVADPAERKSQIEKQIHQAVKSVHGRVPLEKFPDLLEEVVNLVEHPAAILGEFDKSRLDLPPEVLVTSMKKHQKFFPVFKSGEEGAPLLPYFVGLRNGLSENQAVVREGYERVLAARLSDAAFFFSEDRKTRLADRGPFLMGVLFQKELGSMWEKTQRIVELTNKFSGWCDAENSVAERAVRAAHLCKMDLVTSLVGEFPELQGVMGRIYALADGETPETADAVERHYWPLSADGVLPQSGAASLVSLADKMDTLAGDFLVGLIPTGSQDPYGLRRAAVGVIRILEDKKWNMSLRDMIQEAVSSFASKDAASREKASASLMEFFKQRWEALLQAEGFRFDEIRAVMATHFDVPSEARERLTALRAARAHPDFSSLTTAFKRANNILSQAAKKNFPEMSRLSQIRAEKLPAGLREDAEIDLHGRLDRINSDIRALLDGHRYDDVFKNFTGLRAPLDSFFEKVMVMSPEEDLRAARLALLWFLVEIFKSVADFSLLQDVPGSSTPS